MAQFGRPHILSVAIVWFVLGVLIALNWTRAGAFWLAVQYLTAPLAIRNRYSMGLAFELRELNSTPVLVLAVWALCYGIGHVAAWRFLSRHSRVSRVSDSVGAIANQIRHD